MSCGQKSHVCLIRISPVAAAHTTGSVCESMGGACSLPLICLMMKIPSAQRGGGKGGGCCCLTPMQSRLPFATEPAASQTLTFALPPFTHFYSDARASSPHSAARSLAHSLTRRPPPLTRSLSVVIHRPHGQTPLRHSSCVFSGDSEAVVSALRSRAGSKCTHGAG